jgi:glycosyltransferase involved in cell wall biosynthesis
MTIDINDHLQIKLIHAVSYSSNVSVRRLINHFITGRKFYESAKEEPRPDIILSSLPTIELCWYAARYGQEMAVPVVIDVRDLWPDLFLDLFSPKAGWCARQLLYPYFKAARTACSNATAITGLTDAFVDWGVNNAGRQRTELDRVFPMGYTEKVPRENAMAEATAFWNKHGVFCGKEEFISCFFGTIGRQFDLETVIRAAAQLNTLRPGRFRFVLCGNGDNLAYYQNLAGDCKNIFFPGWIDAPKIWTLMRLSTVGLAPYNNTMNFIMNLANKPIEYLSAGLPIVSGLQGVLQHILAKNDCGVTYRPGSSDDLVRILCDLSDNPEKIDHMAKNALNLFCRDFVAEQVYNNMINHLESVTANYGL